MQLAPPPPTLDSLAALAARERVNVGQLVRIWSELLRELAALPDVPLERSVAIFAEGMLRSRLKAARDAAAGLIP